MLRLIEVPGGGLDYVNCRPRLIGSTTENCLKRYENRGASRLSKSRLIVKRYELGRLSRLSNSLNRSDNQFGSTIQAGCPRLSTLSNI